MLCWSRSLCTHWGIVDWTLALYLIVGVVPSVPLSAYTVKKTGTRKLRVTVGIFTVLLGSP